MSTLAIDTFETYPEDISILLDANLGTLGDFIARYYDRFDEGRWKAVFTFIRDRAIKLIRQRLNCMEELSAFNYKVILSATIDEIRKNYPDVAAALNEIVELLLMNMECPDALTVIKSNNPLAWNLLKVIYGVVEAGGWYSMDDLLRRFSASKGVEDVPKCLSELEKIHLVVITTLFEDSVVYKCKICFRVTGESTMSRHYCTRCSQYSMDEVKGESLSLLKKSMLVGLTEAGHALMGQAKRESFYC